MEFKSINPFNGEEIGTYKEHTQEELLQKIDNAQTAFLSWRKVSVKERAQLMANAGKVLRENKAEYSRMMTLEMGKPFAESLAEIEKCAWVCDYYAEHAAAFLADEIIETDAQKSFVRHDPLGCVLAVMPWNFPFWQVFRFAAPTLTAGNTALLKHATNVLGCALQIEEVFQKAGFPKDVFQTLIIHHDKTESIIAHPAVKAVTLTGSERAGASVAEIAGRHLKKSLLELGGNNAFIVLDDADIDKAVKTAVPARMRNAGQSCIAAKRFIITAAVYDEFVFKFIEAVKLLKPGNPMMETTDIGPLAKKEFADTLQKQVITSIDMGAELLLGGNQLNAYHEPTVLGHVKPAMPAFKEETFGPLAAMIKAKDETEAFELAEQTTFGLGVTVCTTDIDKALAMAEHASDGAYFVNELVKSDPRLPFGGTKRSGYGRELAKDGIMEFVNRKTVYVK